MVWFLWLDKWAVEDGSPLMEADLCYDDRGEAEADAVAYLEALRPGERGRAQVLDVACQCVYDATRVVA